jgi:hypothetical protein
MMYLGGTLSFIAVNALSVYLAINVGEIGEGSAALNVLAIFGATSILSFLFLLISKKAKLVKLSNSNLALVVFFNYLIFRIIFDYGDSEKIFEYTIGTTGGIVFFYILGIVSSELIRQFFIQSTRSARTLRFFRNLVIFFLLFNIILFALVCYHLMPRMEVDKFLIQDPDGAYQRPGNFIIINSLMLMSISEKYFLAREINPSIFKKNNIALMALLLTTNTFLAISLSQLIGSNHAAVSVFALWVSFCSLSMLIKNREVMSLLRSRTLRIFSKSFRFIIISIAINSIVCVILTIILIFSIAFFFDVDLMMTRLGGYGTGDNQSVGPRLELLMNNFLFHLDYAPFFGSLKVDCFTTGCGSYVHSFFLSAVTHTGIIGASFLLIYFFLSFREIFSNKDIQPLDKTFSANFSSLFTLLMFSTVFLISNGGVFFTSAAMWFAIGFFVKPVLIGKN